ncbi:DNA gyrase inhibitor YacG [Roseomonas sp. BU-1]|uniref:DNA gyrase inhibitor YacG n=2 Tax=Falsiroseomonas selenitidurans TaxID=2716335 RepID=A0ABX1E1C2_9PROT|nr:DNA gyrase inhibitor YacG [Falsiroseomonas selenitidurans]
MSQTRPMRRQPRSCPICGKPLPLPDARFCSDRCAQVDLGRWLSGSYAIPVREPEDPSEEA